MAAPDLDRVPPGLRPKLGAYIIVHRREPGGIARSFERFEIEFGKIGAVPVEALQHLPQPGPNYRGTIPILKVHELAPVELCILQDSGFLAPLRMIAPEFFTHMRQLDPCVHQHSMAMASTDQALQIFVAFRIGVVKMPGCDMQGADSGSAPALGKVVEVGSRSI